MRAVLLIILFLLGGQTAGALAQGTGQSLFTTIDIHENGNAFWTTEMRTLLSTKSGISEWNLSIKDTNKTKKELEDFSNGINRKIRSAENYSHRSMMARDFNISYETINIQSDTYGIIRLSFEWVGFSLYNDSRIIIGDAFSEERMPSSNDVLIIKIPKGYDEVNATPVFDRQDGNRLIWDGKTYNSFAKGEPNIILQRKAIVQEPFPFMIIVIIILIGAGLFIIWIKRDYFWKKTIEGVEKRQNLDMKTVQTGEVTSVTMGAPAQTGADIAEGVGEVKPAQAGVVIALGEEGDQTGEEEETYSGSFNELPDITEDILGDEEMIEKYLAKVGGQAYQTGIVNESGLSKSKISIVLAKMKDEGRIIKIRKGKENIIRLVMKKKEEEKGTV
ncbi:MAG: hypothetical protein KKG76_14265 [Euryarchaeota archaeon]|nr:hypothetical protein [Euryarchaeota archaeon]